MPKKQRATPVALRTKPKGRAVTKKTAGKDKNMFVNYKAMMTEMKDAKKKLDGTVTKKTAGKDKNILVDSKAMVTEMKDAKKKLDGAVTKKTAVKRLEENVNKEKEIKRANALVSETKDIENGLDKNMDECLKGIKKATQNFWMLANNPEAFESSMSGEAGLLYRNCVHFEGFVGQIEKIYQMSKRNSRNMGGMLQVSEFISTLL